MGVGRGADRRGWRSPDAKLPDFTFLPGAGPVLASHSERSECQAFSPSQESTPCSGVDLSTPCGPRRSRLRGPAPTPAFPTGRRGARCPPRAVGCVPSCNSDSQGEPRVGFVPGVLLFVFACWLLLVLFRSLQVHSSLTEHLVTQPVETESVAFPFAGRPGPG